MQGFLEEQRWCFKTIFLSNNMTKYGPIVEPSLVEIAAEVLENSKTLIMNDLLFR